MLGYVPRGWQDMSVATLNALQPTRRRWRDLETGVFLRAIAIFLVVAHHSRLQRYSGGAHALLAIAGYNYARFTLVPTGRQLGRNVRGIARVLVPSAVVLAVTMTFVEYDGLGKRLLLSNYIDPRAWRYWFIEVLVQILVLLTLLFCIPAVRRRERAAPFAFPLVLLIVVAAVSYASRASFALARDYEYETHMTAFVFVLGWLVYRATTPLQKCLVSALCAVTLLPFFDRPAQSAIVFTAVVTLLWVPSVRVPQLAARVAGVLAGASLYIYLVHFEVVHRLDGEVRDIVVTVLALSSGIAVWFVVRALSARVGDVSETARRWSTRRDEELAGNRVG
jgi:surface polysaccharide O-acyltransferase-like enzyme